MFRIAARGGEPGPQASYLDGAMGDVYRRAKLHLDATTVGYEAGKNGRAGKVAGAECATLLRMAPRVGTLKVDRARWRARKAPPCGMDRWTCLTGGELGKVAGAESATLLRAKSQESQAESLALPVTA